MTHNEFTAHAFITLSNYGGIEIMLNHSCDGVFYRFSYGQDNIENEPILEAEIEYSIDEDSRAFFKHIYSDASTKYYLDEAMRINR